MANLLDLVLIALVLAVAGWVIVARERFAAVVGFVAYGLLLALVWVRIAAPDVALTEAAIGAGITGGLLLAVSTRLGQAGLSPSAERPKLVLRGCAIVLCAIVASGLAGVVLFLPDPAPTLAPAAVNSLAATGLGNPVAAVLIAYRATDTLLEVVVLVLALIGVWSLAPDIFWGGRPGAASRVDSGGALALLARFLSPIGIVVGLHIFWVGSQAPGGEFQGSAILAAVSILVMMSGLADAPAINRVWLRLLLVLGPVVFMSVGFAGFVIPGNFLAYPPKVTKPLILLIEVTLMLSIAAMLSLLVAGPPQRSTRP